MSTSNSDILAYLKATQSDHAKEREEDKKVRAKERQEDMDNILAIIQEGVQKEVRAAVKPIEERLVIQEQVNHELTEKFIGVQNELELLKEKIHNQKYSKEIVIKQHEGPDNVQAQEVQGGYGGARHECEGGGRGQLWEEDHIFHLDMCSHARRVIGFKPIEPRMLDLQVKSFGARNMEEAKVMEIKSFLKCEMKMRQSDIEKLEMIRIFPPAKQDWDVLYVELGSDSQVDMVMSHTRFMVKKDHRVVRWYPKQMYQRYRAVEAIAYEMRKTKKLKTRVKVGLRDIELSTREESSSYWRRQVLPDTLPEFDMIDTRPAIASSPPPGRPWRTQGFALPEVENEIIDEVVVIDDKVVEAATAN